MRTFLALLGAGLKSNFGLSVLRHRWLRQKKDVWMVPLVALAAVSLAPILFYYLQLLKFVYGLLALVVALDVASRGLSPFPRLAIPERG